MLSNSSLIPARIGSDFALFRTSSFKNSKSQTASQSQSQTALLPPFDENLLDSHYVHVDLGYKGKITKKVILVVYVLAVIVK